MAGMDAADIEHFLHAQVAAWNRGDKAAFFDAYRAAAPQGLTIEYVGRGPASDGWPVLEAMWAQQSAKIEIDEVLFTVNGGEAACHNRNTVRGTAVAIETIELYRFDEGRLSVRYFVGQPGAAAQQRVDEFMQGQVACWNAHDKPGFMALYRAFAPNGLEITYAGRDDTVDGWFVIEEMWDKHNAQFLLDVVTTIVNGDEAAVHHRNVIVGTSALIESLETYRFDDGRLLIVYHLKPPDEAGVDLQQFRGFASA